MVWPTACRGGRSLPSMRKRIRGARAGGLDACESSLDSSWSTVSCLMCVSLEELGSGGSDIGCSIGGTNAADEAKVEVVLDTDDGE